MKTNKKYFVITTVSRDDIRALYGDKGRLTRTLTKQIDNLTDKQMDSIASRMADCYLDGDYWVNLEYSFEKVEK